MFYALDEEKTFIPRGCLEEILSPERVYQIVQTLECFKEAKDKHAIAQSICFGSDRNPLCLKVLATLILINRANDIRKCIDNGLCDDCLPSLSHLDNDKLELQCRLHGKHKLPFQDEVIASKDFYLAIANFTAPYIKIRKTIHSHYVLRNRSCLPITTTANYDTKQGGFSIVYQVQIPTSHYKDDLDKVRQLWDASTETGTYSHLLTLLLLRNRDTIATLL